MGNFWEQHSGHIVLYEYSMGDNVPVTAFTVEELYQAFAERFRRENDPKNSTRYPYTHAYDYVRGYIGAEHSRGDVAQAVGKMADSLGVDKEQLCKALADAKLDTDT